MLADLRAVNRVFKPMQQETEGSRLKWVQKDMHEFGPLPFTN